MKRTTLALVAVGTLFLTGSARADDYADWEKHQFGQKGFIISVDRLLPLISYQSVTTTANDGTENKQSRTSVALMNNGPFGVFNSFYNLPRVSFDWVPVRNVTLGGAVWIYADLKSTDTITTPKGASTSTDTPKVTYWGIAPRVGYIIPLGDRVYLWPRAGVEYHHVDSSDVGNGSSSVTQLAFEAEAMLVIAPWRHFAFTLGPTLDAPITGEQTSVVSSTVGMTTVSTTSRVDSAMWQVGGSAGILGHF